MSHDDERSRTVRWSDPAPLIKKARNMSGLEFLRGIVDGTIEEPPISQLMGSHVVKAEEGRVVFEVIPKDGWK